MLTSSQASLLRLFSIGDEASIRAALVDADPPRAALDDRSAALVRLATLVVSDPAVATYQREVRSALDAGVSIDEIVSLLLVLLRPTGTSAVITAAPKLAMALGYDVDEGLEDFGT